jgi:hypothetical protein
MPHIPTSNPEKDLLLTRADLRCLVGLLWIDGEVDLDLEDRRQVEMLSAEITAARRHYPERSIGGDFGTAQCRIDQLRSATGER